MELRQGSGNNKREAQQAISNVSAGNRFVAQLCPNRHRPPRTQTARELLRNCHIEAAAWDPITRNGRLAYALHITLPCFGCRLVVYRNTQNAARARCVSDSGTVHQLNLGERGQPHPFAWGGGGVAMEGRWVGVRERNLADSSRKVPIRWVFYVGFKGGKAGGPPNADNRIH